MAAGLKATQQSGAASDDHFLSRGQFVSVKARVTAPPCYPDDSFISMACGGKFHSVFVSSPDINSRSIVTTSIGER